MNRVNCDACGHQNPAGRLICESCGAPLAASTADPTNMKTQAIPSLDDLLTQDRKAFKGHLDTMARDNQVPEGDQGPTQAIDFNALASQYPEFASPGRPSASAQHTPQANPFGDAEFEDEAAPTEAIDFNKLAELHPELAARVAEDPNRAPAPQRPQPQPPQPQRPQAPQGQVQTPHAQRPAGRDLGGAPPEATAAVKTPPSTVPPARKKSNTLLIVGIVAAVILLCLCPGAIGGLWYGGVLKAVGIAPPGAASVDDKPADKAHNKAADKDKDKADDEADENADEAGE